MRPSEHAELAGQFRRVPNRLRATSSRRAGYRSRLRWSNVPVPAIDCRRRPISPSGRPEGDYCPVCGAEFYKQRAELRAVNYCSRKCSATANRRLRASTWVGGVRRDLGHRRASVATTGRRRRRGHSTATRRHDIPRAWVKVAEPNDGVTGAYRPTNRPTVRPLQAWRATINGDSLDDRLENRT